MIKTDNKMVTNASNNNSSTSTSTSTSTSFSASPAMTTSDRPKHEPEAISDCVKAGPGARSFQEYHGVPFSVAAIDVQETLALLQLGPRCLVAQSPTSTRLLRSESLRSLPMREGLLGEAEGGEREIVAGEKRLRSDDFDSVDIDDSEDEAENKAEHAEEASKTSVDPESDTDASGTKKRSKRGGKRPVDAAMMKGGVQLRPRETAPLLQALGVSSPHLVAVGIVECGAFRDMSGRRGHDPHKYRRICRRHPGGGGHGGRPAPLRRERGYFGGFGERTHGGRVEEVIPLHADPPAPPRHVSPDGPPHGSPYRGPPSGGIHGGRPAPLRRCRGYYGGFGGQTNGEDESEEVMPMHSSPPGPIGGPDRHGPRHYRGGEMSNKAHGAPHGPSDGSHPLKRGILPHGPGCCFGEYQHDGESGEEEIVPMQEEEAACRSPQGGGHRGHHDGLVGHRRGHRGQTHAALGLPSAPPPPPDHDRVGTMCDAGEEAMLLIAPPGPRHHVETTASDEEGVRSQGQFRRLFHEGVTSAQHGRTKGHPGRCPPCRGGRMGLGGRMHGGVHSCGGSRGDGGGGGVGLSPGRLGHRVGRGGHCCGPCPHPQKQ